MKHFANVRDVVIKLKGTIPQPLNTKKIELGKNAGEALVISIKNEILTIQFYESVQEKIASQSKSAKTILQMLDKLIADESLHLKLFYQQLVKMKLTQGVESLKSTLTRYLKLDYSAGAAIEDRGGERRDASPLQAFIRIMYPGRQWLHVPSDSRLYRRRSVHQKMIIRNPPRTF